MTENQLLKNINRLGFPLLETTKDIDANKTLAEVVKSRDMRLWEGFPVLLANSVKENLFDYDLVRKHLKAGKLKEDLDALLLMSLALYQFHHLSFGWSDAFKDKFFKEYLERLKEMRNSIVHNKEFSIGGRKIQPMRLKEIFGNYFEKDVEDTRKLKERHEELSLEYALSQLFSPKQKELFKKKLTGQPLNKTEREYFSRTVRKKVQALANRELHRLAQKLMEY